MSQKTFNYIVGVVFSIVGLLQLIRSILGWSVNIEGVNIVVGASVIFFLLAFFLAYNAFKLTIKEKEIKKTLNQEKLNNL